MKALSILFILALLQPMVQAQKLISKTGHITFFSSAPLEDIEAHNNAVASIFDTKTGKVQVSMFIKSFEFKKALMQEHFNENYMESEKYPKSTFTGNIQEVEKYNFSKAGTYELTAKGELTIHGVTKEVELPVTLNVEKAVMKAKSVFIVKTADYNIEIPALVKDNIAKEIEVTVEIPFDLK